PQQPVPMRIINQPPRRQQPTMQEQSYKDLIAYVKNAYNAWDKRNGVLKSDFVTTMIQKARIAHLDDFQLESLLQTARDMHGEFSGNQKRDVAILQSVDAQIITAIRQK